VSRLIRAGWEASGQEVDGSALELLLRDRIGEVACVCFLNSLDSVGWHTHSPFKIPLIVLFRPRFCHDDRSDNIPL
jgi:hypothetical protein